MRVIKGGCLCGGIRYEYNGLLHELSMCHCKQCQKAQGTAFAAVCPVESAKLKFVSGTELLKEYRATPGKVRVFCANCGSPVYSARDDLPEVKRLRAGTVDTPFSCKNAYHVFSESRACWDEITDDLPRYPQFKPIV